MKVKAKRVHHIGVTVDDAERVVDLWSKLLDCEARVVHLKEKQLKIGVVRVAGVTFFFNEVTDPSKKAQVKQSVAAPIVFGGHKIINSKTEGITHISFEVEQLDSSLRHARDLGVNILLDDNRDALEGICNFLDPEQVALPLEFMQPVEGRQNPLE